MPDQLPRLVQGLKQRRTQFGWIPEAFPIATPAAGHRLYQRRIQSPELAQVLPATITAGISVPVIGVDEEEIDAPPASEIRRWIFLMKIATMQGVNGRKR